MRKWAVPAAGKRLATAERYVPCGVPEDVAEAIAPYLAVGCRRFNFVPEAPSLPAATVAASEVKALLAGVRATPVAPRP